MKLTVTFMYAINVVFKFSRLFTNNKIIFDGDATYSLVAISRQYQLIQILFFEIKCQYNTFIIIISYGVAVKFIFIAYYEI